MRSYTVHTQKASAAGILSDADGAHVIKEGFCWPALFIPLVWLVYQRLWLALMAYAAVVFGGGLAMSLAGVSDEVGGLIGLGGDVLFALVANDLRRWSVEARGHEYRATVFAPSLDAAERRFFAALAGSKARPGPSAPRAKDAAGKPKPGPEPVLGLFPAAGG